MQCKNLLDFSVPMHSWAYIYCTVGTSRWLAWQVLRLKACNQCQISDAIRSNSTELHMLLLVQVAFIILSVVHQSASQSYESFSFALRFRFQSICLAFLAGVIPRLNSTTPSPRQRSIEEPLVLRNANTR